MRRSRFIVCLGLAVLADAFAASAELNPVRTHPTIQGEPAVQGVIVKLRALEPGSDAHARAAADPAACEARRPRPQAVASNCAPPVRDASGARGWRRVARGNARTAACRQRC